MLRLLSTTFRYSKLRALNSYMMLEAAVRLRSSSRNWKPSATVLKQSPPLSPERYCRCRKSGRSDQDSSTAGFGSG